MVARAALTPGRRAAKRSDDSRSRLELDHRSTPTAGLVWRERWSSPPSPRRATAWHVRSANEGWSLPTPFSPRVLPPLTASCPLAVDFALGCAASEVQSSAASAAAAPPEHRGAALLTLESDPREP